MRSASALSALVGAVALFALVPAAGYADVIDDPLHGFCAGCNDNGTVTPIPTNPPSNFTFTASGGPTTGELFLDVLIPNVGSPPATITGTIGATPFTTTKVDTAWTTGTLQAFLTANTSTNFSSASPNNPIGAFPGSTTGFFVFQADLGQQTLGPPNNNPAGPNISITQMLAMGSSIVAFLNTGTSTSPNFIATAPSGQLFVPGPVVGAGLPGMMAACGALLALARRRRRQAA